LYLSQYLKYLLVIAFVIAFVIIVTMYYCLFIIRSTCNSRDTLLAEALIYRLRGHYVGLRRKSGPIRFIRADIVTLWAISALI